ncbi:MAG: N-acetyl-gamma-glutamyl-phosphate reductase [Marinilabiliaceae bacterium]|nr:N-acetyl-gamma-glutamyl-phosphate reductase [Marinilabiliaceae bacterium]
MIKVGIVGGAGYTAGELIRILINHPLVELKFIQSTSNAGNPIIKVHNDLVGETDLVFCNDLPLDKVDVVFLCMGHGKSVEFMTNNSIPENLRVIDLSTDYRMRRNDHSFVYGLPELLKDKIKDAKYIANPGCFATAIQMAFLPVAFVKKLTEVHIHAITGSTGAGQAPTATTHFSWRSSNTSVYKAFSHQHLNEIGQTIRWLQPGFDADVNFVPVRGDFPRGIMASVYFESDLTKEEAKKLYSDFYKDHPFTVVVDKNPDLKQVVNTNKAVVFVEKFGNKIHVVSMIDNLLKGASGQAVQNMNLMFGIDETTGLKLKPVAF